MDTRATAITAVALQLRAAAMRPAARRASVVHVA
jgi:hypothetical protein